MRGLLARPALSVQWSRMSRPEQWFARSRSRSGRQVDQTIAPGARDSVVTKAMVPVAVHRLDGETCRQAPAQGRHLVRLRSRWTGPRYLEATATPAPVGGTSPCAPSPKETYPLADTDTT